MTVSKRELAELYKRESNLKMKERLLLTLRVEVDGGGEVPGHVVQKELHRSKPWGSYWLDRYNKEEGIEEGLKDKLNCGRTSHLPSEIALKIR